MKTMKTVQPNEQTVVESPTASLSFPSNETHSSLTSISCVIRGCFLCWARGLVEVDFSISVKQQRAEADAYRHCEIFPDIDPAVRTFLYLQNKCL